ncbi:MAG: helix-turn-helix transcriptional regulator, partial [Ilumatobacteraceae bacterium]
PRLGLAEERLDRRPDPARGATVHPDGGDRLAEPVLGDLGEVVLGELADGGLATDRGELAIGRSPPRFRYRVTTDADRLFPKAYGELTNELLGFLDDPAIEERLFDRRRDQRIEQAAGRMEGRTLTERVEILADILDADGYMATWEALDDGSFVVAERNCAIAAVAMEHPGACRSEIDFIRAVLPDATVERTSHMVAGDLRCAYNIHP